MDTNRDIYKDDVDFSALALQDPEFNKYVKSNGQLDFSNPEAVQQLTKSLLKRDFGLQIELPEDRLCPPVPNRFCYILWIQGLLDSTSESYTDQYDPERDVVGLDIGTGASCIYPLLGCAQRPKWRFAATDIDEKNFQYACKNILTNSLKARIRPLKTTSSDPLIPLNVLGLDSISFTICNPPFYASIDELLTSAKAKSRPPHTACTGADIEMVTPGGEVSFINRMIEESCNLKERVQWYTSMLGFWSSVGIIVEKLKEKGIENWAVKTFVHGEKTRRWGVAWSWGSMRPPMDVARGTPSTLPRHLLPFPSEYTVCISYVPLDNIVSRINTTIQGLDMRWRYQPSIFTGVGFTKENVWSRSARRNQQKRDIAVPPSVGKADDDGMHEDSEEDEEPALGFKVQVRQWQEGSVVEVCIRWLQGNQSVLFESFCGMLKRQISQDAGR